ncbi:MAG: FG-GAP repeat protein [Planctomycetes bacterium]|nr:FG-GAP repeat protein [Planctomycetota bacterium]
MKCQIRPFGILSVMTLGVVGGAGSSAAWAQCQANELAKLTASDAAQSDHFGESVSISGDVALIGAHNDVHAGIWSGSAYVYRYDPDTSAWVQQQKLVASDAEWGDEFGHSVSISGDVAFITAIASPGSVYVFRYDPQRSQWIEAQQLLVPDGLGSAVCVEGDVALIGAASDDDAGQGSGAAYIFRLNKQTGRWEQEARLNASDAAAWDLFGSSVSISGDVALIGAPFDDDVPNDSGSAYVFVKPEGGWVDMTETGKLTASDPAGFDMFGFSVSISGDIAVMGAWGDNDAGSGSGSAYVFEKPDGGWVDMTETAKLTASDAAAGDVFGFSVSISGNVALIGAHGNDDGETASGSAYVFRLNQLTGLWEEQAKVTASEGGPYDQFGNSVAISGDMAVIGAFDDDDVCPDDPDCDSGSAYIFAGLSDCNDNGMVDLCDIADGTSSDTNANGIPDECECLADFDRDGNVGILDLLALLAAWGTDPGGPPDFDGDGNVGILDLLTLLANWGACP